jgi:hypothetical protein
MNRDVLNVLNIGPFSFRDYTDRVFLKHYLNKASLLTARRRFIRRRWLWKGIKELAFLLSSELH